MNKLQTYSKYKFSGTEWLGDIPEQWEVKKVKNVFRLVTEPAPKNNDFELLSVYTDIGVKPRAELEERGNKASTTDGYWFVKKGDIVVNKLLAWMGAIGVSNYDGVTSPAYDILRAKVQIDSNFFHYLFRNESCISELKKHSRGIMDMRLRLYFDKFGDVIVPFPSFLEQQKIVEFLDRKTTLIDQAIGIKQKQIELLKERRQILIHKAVTKGLNPHAKMKDSGVEWIGEIPEGWEVKRLASFGKFSKGGGFSKADLTENGVSAILYGDIYTKYDIQIKQGVRFIANETAKKSIEIKKGNLLFTGSGETMEDIGKCVVFSSDEKTVAGGDVIIFEQNQNENLYLSYVLNTEGAKFEKARFSKGEIIVHTYGSKLKNIYIPIPPIEEQKQIDKYIETATTKIATAITFKEQEIDKLKEYKSSLVNGVVTGKVRVC